jgi:hypothetical protein
VVSGRDGGERGRLGDRQESWTLGLGGAADLRVFRVLRALSDAILLGAATIRTRLGAEMSLTDIYYDGVLFLRYRLKPEDRP